MTVGVEVDALSDAQDYFRSLPDVSRRAARLALNSVSNRGAMRLARGGILDQVAFPKDYLTGDRLQVTKHAKENDLETVITGRKRATSLARFATSGAVGGGAMSKGGVRVMVKSGQGRVLRNAWLVRLRSGASMTEDNYNVGLALRVKPGDTLGNKNSAHKSWLVPNSIALLYGPSVDQVFRDVSDEIAPRVAQMVADEFFRQFDRLL